MGQIVRYTGLGVIAILGTLTFLKRAIWDYYSSVMP